MLVSLTNLSVKIMTYIIIIFFIATIGAFGMLLFRVWEIKTSRIIVSEISEEKLPSRISFRYIETIILYLAKHAIQWTVLLFVKLWYLLVSRIKLIILDKLPKINRFFNRISKSDDPRKISFVQRAVIESKIKIKRVKEKIKKEHEEKEEEIIENNEVDKII